LIEEYFDGEVTGQTGEQVGAHLVTCATCAAALDALSFEQEIYARYDRGGLEVTPDLWARVSAEIARTPPVHESPAAGGPFLSRARHYFAAALGALAVRPALASSLALLVVAAGAGTLWLARRTQPGGTSQQVARQNTPAPPVVAVAPQAPDTDNVNQTQTGTIPSINNEGNSAPAAYEPREAREAETAPKTNTVQRGGADIDVARLLNDSPAAVDDPGIVKFSQDEQVPVDHTADIFVNASAPAGDLVASNAQMLDPDEKEVARHVERAQMLLRSIKNVRASDAGGPDIAYEKSLSRKLLAENATLQLEAEVRGDKETKQVLDRIEPFLLEIANMGEKPSREEVRSIRERVRSNEIVAALEVY
jgi:hypothetical protein